MEIAPFWKFFALRVLTDPVRSLLLHGAVADDDDLLEVLSTLGEDDLQRERSATEGYGLRGIADAGDDEVPILGGTDGEIPVDIGDDA